MATIWGQTIFLSSGGGEIAQFISGSNPPQAGGGNSGNTPATSSTYSNDWIRYTASSSYDFVSGSDITYTIKIYDTSTGFTFTGGASTISGSYAMTDPDWPNLTANGRVVKYDDINTGVVGFDIVSGSGIQNTVTGSRLYFYDGEAKVTFRLGGNWDTYTSSAQPDELYFRLGHYELNELSGGSFTGGKLYIPASANSQDYRYTSHTSSVEWTMQDWRSINFATPQAIHKLLYPGATTIYSVTQSWDGNLRTDLYNSVSPSNQSTPVYYSNNLPAKVGDTIYTNNTGTAASALTYVLGDGSITANSYVDFSTGGNNTIYHPWRYMIISKGEVVQTYHNDTQLYPNWDPYVNKKFTGSFEWSVDSVDNENARTYQVQSSTGYWYEWKTKGSTTFRSTVEPILQHTQSGDLGTTFTKGTFYHTASNDYFGDLSAGWRYENLNIKAGNTQPTSATDYSETRPVYYLTSGSERDWVSEPIGIYWRTGSSQNEESLLREFNDTGSVQYHVSGSGEVLFHTKDVATNSNNNYWMHYNGAFFARLFGTYVNPDWLYAYGTQSQDTSVGTFYLGSDINGNILSGSTTSNGGNLVDLYSSTVKFTTNNSSKWPAYNDTLEYFEGPNSGSTFTPSSQVYIPVLTAEIPTTDSSRPAYDASLGSVNFIRVNTNGTIAQFIQNVQ